MNPTEAYSLRYDEGWDLHFQKMDSTTQERILRKIQQLKQPLNHRHLKGGLPYFVEEAGGYRIAFQIDEKTMTKIIRFVGDHKQYEKWYKSV